MKLKNIQVDITEIRYVHFGVGKKKKIQTVISVMTPRRNSVLSFVLEIFVENKLTIISNEVSDDVISVFRSTLLTNGSVITKIMNELTR